MSEVNVRQITLKRRPERTRRLSPLRVVLAIGIVMLLTAGGYGGYHFWSSTRAVDSYAPWFAGYVDVTTTPTYAFESPDLATEKSVVLSFVVASTNDPCEPSWGTYYSLDTAAEGLDLDRRIVRLVQLGGAVTVSFGGVINNELATECTDPDELVDAYAAVVDRYNISTIDLDIEGDDLSNTAAGERRALAIKTLQDERKTDGKALKVWMTLPVDPKGLTAEGTAAVKQMIDAGVDLTGVNAMTMDYGGSKQEGDSMATASIDALNATHDQLGTLYSTAKIELTSAELWSKIGATPMIGQNDVPDEVFTLKDAKTLNAFAQEKQLGRMSMWSLNRDQNCGPNFINAGTVSNACSGVDQGDTFFSKVLGTRFVKKTLPIIPESVASAPADKGANQTATRIVDDPITSPYVVWDEYTVFDKGTKVVWQANVFEAKWWTKGDVPDDPTVKSFDAAWTLIGPVLASDLPRTRITLPVGTYLTWDPVKIYGAGDRILIGDVPYEAQWWSQTDSPEASLVDPDAGPWRLLTGNEITAVNDGTYVPPVNALAPTAPMVVAG